MAEAKIRSVAVLGGGVIGMSWSALFLARGLAVRLHDLDPGALDRARAYVANAWPALAELGLAPGADRSRITFHADPAEAVRGADLAQENVPERLEIKHALFRAIEPALGADTLVCTSTSGLLMSELQRAWKDPRNLVLAHPFNPPHLVPLVELYGNERTDPGAVDRAEAFYRSIGKVTIRLNKEVPGHVANRLQAAVIREAVHLAAEGVASVADIDTAMSAGPGVRWAVIGPHMVTNLAAGPAGVEVFWERYLPSFETWWASLGQPKVTPEVVKRLARGIEEMVAGRSFEQLAAERDAGVLHVLKRKK
jgi:carnitine 3-dehydrogenase